MIKAININKENHTADFKCTKHGGIVSGLNLTENTNRFLNNPNVENQYVISIDGSKLTPSCDCSTLYPTWDNNNEIGYQLGEARQNA